MKNMVQTLAMASALGLFLPACGGKVQQCNELIKEINAAQTEINEATSAFNDPEKAKKVHDEIEAEIKKIEAVSISDEKLKEFQQKWVDGLNKFNKELEKVSKIKDDPSSATKLMKDITDSSNDLGNLVDETNKYCQGG